MRVGVRLRKLRHETGKAFPCCWEEVHSSLACTARATQTRRRLASQRDTLWTLRPPRRGTRQPSTIPPLGVAHHTTSTQPQPQDEWILPRRSSTHTYFTTTPLLPRTTGIHPSTHCICDHAQHLHALALGRTPCAAPMSGIFLHAYSM